MTGVPSDRIGHYEIIRELGRGGMGVVYLGRDTRLDRDVAIKALPVELASDPGCLERFVREAKTLAGLHHANIVGIYGVEEQDGAKYLVLEFVEGETLADRIDRGPIPLDEALELGAQIAAGVEAAHEAGVIHRDLKPGNIIVTPEGQARVLDFGLARFDDGASSTGVRSDTQTITAAEPQQAPTVAGTILGTAAYMSPEQARGRRVDRRTDIWAFGVVLYEMLVGSSPFQGETATDTLGAVLHKDFSVDAIPAGTPRMVRHVLRRCLERDKTRRFQSIGDIRIELEEALKRLETGERDELGLAPSERRGIWPVVAACLLVTTLTGFGLWLTKPTAPSDAATIEVEPVRERTAPSVLTVEQITDLPVTMQRAAMSPDAATVVYSASREGEPADLYRLRIGGTTPFPLTRSMDGHENHPAVSPDGSSIAYWTAGDAPGQQGIFQMGATGESPRRIVEPPALFPAWSPDGASLVYTTTWWNDPYSRAGPGALWIVDLATRERRTIDTTDPAANADSSEWSSDATGPDWSPDGTRIAYWGVRGGTRDIFTVSPAGGDVIRITDDVHTDWNPIWGPDSRSLWFLSDRGGQSGIWWIALADDGTPAGAPRPIVLGPGGISQMSRSADGRSMIALVASGRELVERVRFDPETERFVGSPEVLLESSTKISSPDISPDGTWIAFHSAAPQEDITVMRLDGTGRRRLTEGPAKDRNARWTPDGRTLYYQSNENGDYELWTVERDTAEARVRPVPGVPAALSPVVSPDGTQISFSSDDGRIYVAPLGEDGSVLEARAAPEGFYDSVSNWWSPDSRWIDGQSESPDEGRICAVLDTEANVVVPVRTPDGDGAPWFSSVCWIDATRILVSGRGTNPPFVFDVVSGASREVEEAPARPGRFLAFHADGWLYTHREDESSNLWLVRLEAAGAE